MTSIKQREELQSAIWRIANEVRGAVDGWDFKQFVLCTLLYRFISENFANFIQGGDDNFHYTELTDDAIIPEIKDDATKTKGYFIYPSQFGAEQKIRKYLVDHNFVEAVISLPANLFYGATIAINIIVLSKHKTEAKTQLIDAGGKDFFKKETNNNVLLPEHIDRIVSIFEHKEEVKYVATSVDNAKIAENDYNLSVSSYVEAEDKREIIDIDKLKAEVAETVKRIDALWSDIDSRPLNSHLSSDIQQIGI